MHGQVRGGYLTVGTVKAFLVEFRIPTYITTNVFWVKFHLCKEVWHGLPVPFAYVLVIRDIFQTIEMSSYRYLWFLTNFTLWPEIFTISSTHRTNNYFRSSYLFSKTWLLAQYEFPSLIPFSISCKLFKRLNLRDWCKKPHKNTKKQKTIDTCNTKEQM